MPFPSALLDTALLNASEGKEALKSFKPNLWYEITPNNNVNIYIGASEMGQGAHTALSMIIADELEADWKQVRVQQGWSAKEIQHPSYPGGANHRGKRECKGVL